MLRTASDAGAATRTVRDVVPGVHLVTHGHTNCYVVEDPAGGGVTLVDAAFPGTWSLVRRCLADIGRSVSDVAGLVITHGHFDHVGFAGRLQRAHGVEVWAHAGDAHLLRHPYRYRPERPRLLCPLTHPRALPVLGSMVAAGALRVPGLDPDHLVDTRTVLDLPGDVAALDVATVLPGHGEPWRQGGAAAVARARAAGVA